MRILLADHQLLVRQGLRALLEVSGLRTVVEAGDTDGAVEAARRLLPDVALLDDSLPPARGLATARLIARACARTRVILLTPACEECDVLEAFAHGVRGVIRRTQPAEDLLFAIRAVDRGGFYAGPAPSGALLEACRPAPSVARAPLSEREREVLQLVSDGKTTKQVAALLSISVKTAEFYRTRIMRKLDIHATAGLVRYAIRHGLITP